MTELWDEMKSTPRFIRFRFCAMPNCPYSAAW